jgi:hypothetical protein
MLLASIEVETWGEEETSIIYMFGLQKEEKNKLICYWENHKEISAK